MDRRKQSMPRREFLRRCAALGAAAAVPTITPASALGLDGGTTASDRITIGVIGVGGKGTNGMRTFMACRDAQVVAVCDVNAIRRERARRIAHLPAGAAYNDFRDLLARSDVDAVLIASPDHWHAFQAIAAVTAGKDVYCEKPMCNTIAEGRRLVDAVRRYGAVFQHGTQLRSRRGTRLACELARNGHIGRLHTVRIGSPPGRATGTHPPMPVPKWLDYDMFLGPAPYAPYTEMRVRRPAWYFIADYSKSGWIAGYGVHDVDIAHWGMGTELTGPVEIEGGGVFPKDGLFDTVMTYDLEFRYAGGVRLIMTDTGKNRHGVRFEGKDGWVFTRGGIDALPKSLLSHRPRPGEIRLYESRSHEQNFIDCVKTRRPTITPVEVAHRSTSACLLGGIAVKLARKLRWDPVNERFLNDPEANRLLSYAPRPPWTL